MPRNPSFDTLVERLHAGDEAAAAEVFGRFVTRLITLARAHLEQTIRNKEDPEEVVQSVFRSFFRRQRAGQFTLDSWESLWGILTVITLRKCRNRAEYFHAACRDVQREVPLASTGEPASRWEAVAREPTPAEAAVLADTVDSLMRGLEGTDRAILALHLQDYSVPEICRQVGYAERTVWRSLSRIRKRLRRMEDQC
jgi:DNA-directed RNA polymerase specialized sigma24 family protein